MVCHCAGEEGLKSFAALLLAASLSACGLAPREPDVADYQTWIAKPENAQSTKKLQAFLNQQGVGEVLPLYQLLRSDTKWKLCGAEPFIVPPERLWRNMVPTLRVVRDKVIPAVGPVEALSVFRSKEINSCIRGASASYHMQFKAIDMRPVKSVTRDQLIVKLCGLHYREGAALNMGLGIYSGTRFHADAAGYRRWGSDYHAASSPCRS